MIDESMKSRVLVIDGKWVVPEEERPANWREILPDAPPVATAVEIAPEAAPVEIEPETTPIPEPQRKRKDTRVFRPGWVGLKHAIERSFADAKATPELTQAALVIVAGIWSRDPAAIAKRIPGAPVYLYAKRCVELGLWKDDGVDLGEIDDERCGDLPLVLRAMCVTWCAKEKKFYLRRWPPMSEALTLELRRELVLAAIERIKRERARWKDLEADPASSGDERLAAKRVAVETEREFAWQWQNVEELLNSKI